MKNMTKKLMLATVALPLMIGSVSVFADGPSPASVGPATNVSPADGPVPLPPNGGPAPLPHKWGPKPPPMCRPDRMVGLDPHMMKELHFTKGQHEKLRAFRIAEMKEMRATENAHEKRLNRLLNADKFDKATARKLVSEMENTRVERKVAMLERQFKILHILTPEQKAEYMKLKRERKQQCEERMHHRLAQEPRKPAY